MSFAHTWVRGALKQNTHSVVVRVVGRVVSDAGARRGPSPTVGVSYTTHMISEGENA